MKTEGVEKDHPADLFMRIIKPTELGVGNYWLSQGMGKIETGHLPMDGKEEVS